LHEEAWKGLAGGLSPRGLPPPAKNEILTGQRDEGPHCHGSRLLQLPWSHHRGRGTSLGKSAHLLPWLLHHAVEITPPWEALSHPNRLGQELELENNLWWFSERELRHDVDVFLAKYMSSPFLHVSEQQCSVISKMQCNGSAVL